MHKSEGGNSARVKRSNQVAIREMIFRDGPITRAEISKRLRLTLPTITTNVNTMIASGVVREISPAPTDDRIMGRPATPVDIVPSAVYFIGAEMRGTCRRVCLTDLRGNILYVDFDERPCEDYTIALESVCTLIRNLLTKDLVPREKISRIGICTPGIVNSETGILEIHPGYNWENKPVFQDVARLTGFTGPIIVENNARARAYGTMVFRQDAIEQAQSFAYLLISAGIACPFILNSGITTATALGAGEVGHIVVDPLGPRCRCGNRGCLEALSSDASILNACHTALAMGEESSLTEISQARDLTIEDVLAAQAAGDRLASRVVSKALYYISLTIANLYNFIRPDIWVIEGALFNNHENRSSMLATVYENLYFTIHNANFVFLEPDANSGALGAAAAAIRSYLADYTE